MKYSDLCKPLYKDRGDVVAVRLDDEIKIIHKEKGGEKKGEGSKVDDKNDVGGGREQGRGRINGERLRRQQDLRRYCLRIEY